MGALVCATAVFIVATSAPSDAAFGRGLVELVIVGTPIAAGLYALRAGADTRFGFSLLWVGFAWSVTALTESSHSIPYTIGRISTWFILPSAVYLLLAFPGGRIARGFDRAVFAGFLAVWAFLFVGTAPLVEAFPPKTLWSTCTTDCPANAVFVLDRQPGFLADLILVREWLIELLCLGLLWSMLRRWRAASPLQRRAIAPVFGAGALVVVFQIAHHTYRQLGGPTDTVVALSSAWTLSIAALCATYPLGLFWRRRVLGRTLVSLGPALRESDSPARVRDALATALGDSSLELLVRDREAGGWRDAYDRSRTWPRPLPAGRAATPISADHGAAEVVLVHDVSLCDDDELLDGVAGTVLAGWRHKRLAADLAEAMSDLEQSRRRIAEAAVDERARIERDLHDGAQQRLIALRIHLGLAETRFQTDPAGAIADIGRLELEVDRALDELRSLARGVYPPELAAYGLAAALQALEWHDALPVHIADSGIARHAMDVESAVYFTCVEAVQNAMKHAGSSGVWVRLGESDDALQFEVRDDGRGMPPHAKPGQGLRNMRDRVEAIGGRLTVESQPGRGTRVIGSVAFADP